MHRALFVALALMSARPAARAAATVAADWDDPKPAAERTTEGFRAAETARIEQAAKASAPAAVAAAARPRAHKK